MCVGLLFEQSQEGIAPRMFKSLIGRGHPEFSTNRQQDAEEFLRHLFNIIEVITSSQSAIHLQYFVLFCYCLSLTFVSDLVPWNCLSLLTWL